MFNLVLAFDEISSLEIEMIYQQVILKVTAALKYEQLRRGYVRKEIELILGLKEEALQYHTGNTLIIQSSL
jgi:hypothetical protein